MVPQLVLYGWHDNSDIFHKNHTEGKLLNSDWFRQGIFFVNFCLPQEKFQSWREDFQWFPKMTRSLPKIAKDDLQISENHPRFSEDFQSKKKTNQLSQALPTRLLDFAKFHDVTANPFPGPYVYFALARERNRTSRDSLGYQHLPLWWRTSQDVRLCGRQLSRTRSYKQKQYTASACLHSEIHNHTC